MDSEEYKNCYFCENRKFSGNNFFIQEHSGRIYALSDGLNKGSTFYVELKRLSSHN